MSKRSTTAALKDIREDIERIQRYVGELSLDDFLDNIEKQDAVVRNFEIIGEAAKSLPAEFRKKHQRSNGPTWLAFETSSFTTTSA